MENKRLIIILTTAAILLSIPFIAMQFINDMDWGIFDFALMAGLLFGAGLLCELVMRKVKSNTYRIVVCCVVLFAFFLIWAELAVGIFGTFFAGS